MASRAPGPAEWSPLGRFVMVALALVYAVVLVATLSESLRALRAQFSLRDSKHFLERARDVDLSDSDVTPIG
ncbi:MAG: hypothetical protein ABI836_06455 [Gemmatimonadota bacterium]